MLSSRPLFNPVASSTASNCFRRSAKEISRPSVTRVCSFTPSARILSTSILMISRGSRNCGMPRYNIPPGTGADSNTSTEYPSSARSCAHVSPQTPAPITAIFLFRFGAGDCFFRTGSCPVPRLCRSVANRFSAQIAIGSSIFPRRQLSSHGCAQMRPSTYANGFGARASRYASSSCEIPIDCT